MSAPVLDAATTAFVTGGVAVVVGTCDAERRPAVSRGWGPRVADGGRTVELCVAADRSRPATALDPGSAIAVTFSRPSTYQGVQVKGHVLAAGAPTEEHLRLVGAHVNAFLEETAPLGLSPAILAGLAHGPLHAVTVAVEALFDQTPGPGAGRAR